MPYYFMFYAILNTLLSKNFVLKILSLPHEK